MKANLRTKFITKLTTQCNTKLMKKWMAKLDKLKGRLMDKLDEEVDDKIAHDVKFVLFFTRNTWLKEICLILEHIEKILHSEYQILDSHR